MYGICDNCGLKFIRNLQIYMSLFTLLSVNAMNGVLEWQGFVNFHSPSQFSLVEF